MLIKIKTLPDSIETIAVEKEMTVLELKELICENKKYAFLPDAIGLVCRGRILRDKDLLQKYNLAEDDTVLMTIPTKARLEQKTREKAEETLAGKERTDEMVENIATLGFPREHVLHALEHCQNDPNLAVEYLMGGFQEEGQGGTEVALGDEELLRAGKCIYMCWRCGRLILESTQTGKDVLELLDEGEDDDGETITALCLVFFIGMSQQVVSEKAIDSVWNMQLITELMKTGCSRVQAIEALLHAEGELEDAKELLQLKKDGQ
ncbi:MAG: UV excision repair protein RAD23-like protein [Amphiamblys sp. WSBS2006]|nr:MAG: UV excision repair protein RAD23-like protein [Amphiamblys sp. WSBS2006]